MRHLISTWVQARFYQITDRFVPRVQDLEGLSIQWHYRVVSAVFLIGVILGPLVLLAALPMIAEKEIWDLLILDLLVWITALVMLVSKRISLTVKIVVGLALLYTVGVAICLKVGVLSGGPAWLFCFVVFSGVFLGTRAALWALLLNALSLLAMGLAVHAGIWGQEFPFFNSVLLMVSTGLNYLFLNGVAAVAISILVQGQFLARQKENELTASLKESNRRFNCLADAAVEAIFFVRSRVCLQANQTAAQMLGFESASDLVGVSLSHILSADSPDLMDSKDPIEVEGMRRDGSCFPAIIRSSSVGVDGAGEVLVVTMEDLTEKKRSEKINKTLFAISNAVSLTRSLEDLFGQIHYFLGKVLDTTNFFIALVDQAEKTLSFTYFVDEEETEKPGPTVLDATGSLTGLVAEKKSPVIFYHRDLEILARENNVEGPVPLIWMGVPLMIKENVIGVTAVQSYRNAELYDAQDLALLSSVSGQIALAIDRKRAEDALRESEAKYRHLFDNAPAAIYELDFIGKRITNVNGAMCVYTGYSKEELLAMTPFDLLAEESRQVFHDDLKKVVEARPASRAYDYKIRKKTGEVLSVILYAEFVYDQDRVSRARVVVHDITERKKIEAMMIRTEKMMSIAGLAAGMAHEINNPLAGMIQNAQVMQNRLSKDLPANVSAAEEAGISMSAIAGFMEKRGIFRQIRHIQEAGARAAQIVDNMLRFAGDNTAVKEDHRLDRLLDDTISLARNDFDLKKKYDVKQIKMIREYGPVAPVPCQGSKMQQVFFNLIRNAAQAMTANTEQKDPPRMTFRIEDLGTGVRMEVSDNGPGMDEETRKRAFEPFFTTKGVDQGTGLGLAIAYYIVVEDHGGQMDVRSSPGQGCSFTIVLPRA